jgi:hypothetical protein
MSKTSFKVVHFGALGLASMILESAKLSNNDNTIESVFY